MLTFSNMDRMSREPGSFPNQAAFLWQEGGDFPAHQFVADGLVAVRVDLVRVGDFPRPTRTPVVIGHGFRRGGELGLVRIERVAVFVLRAAHFARPSFGVDLEDGVLWTVDVGVDPKAEEMLVVVRVDAGIDLGAPAVSVFSRIHGVGV